MIAVPLLLQAVPLQYGSDMLWRILDEDFNAEDWRVRFAAVEKATLIFRLASVRMQIARRGVTFFVNK